jgi:predicted alpha/beta hydrolase
MQQQQVVPMPACLVALLPAQVITTPFSSSFDYLRIADEAQYKFDRAVRALGHEAVSLPVYGVGHSLGAVVHLLICTRYAVTVSVLKAASLVVMFCLMLIAVICWKAVPGNPIHSLAGS